jgi:hypothetical protein
VSLQKICDLRGWPAGSDKNTETHEVMFKIWEGLRSKADKDNDGQVSWMGSVMRWEGREFREDLKSFEENLREKLKGNIMGN